MIVAIYSRAAWRESAFLFQAVRRPRLNWGALVTSVVRRIRGCRSRASSTYRRRRGRIRGSELAERCMGANIRPFVWCSEGMSSEMARRYPGPGVAKQGDRSEAESLVGGIVGSGHQLPGELDHVERPRGAACEGSDLVALLACRKTNGVRKVSAPRSVVLIVGDAGGV